MSAINSGEDLIGLMRKVQPKQTETVALGTVTTASGPYVTFDGDTSETTSALPVLGSYVPTLNDRVLLNKVNGQWLIIDKVSTMAPIRYYEEYTVATGTTAVTNTAFNIKGQTLTKLIGTSAYNTSTGAWTAPIDGIYCVQNLTNYSFSGTQTRTLVTLATGAGNTGTIFARDDTPATRNGVTQTVTKWFAAGTTVYVAVQPAGGALLTAVAGSVIFTLIQATS